MRYDTPCGATRYGLASSMIAGKLANKDGVVCKVKKAPHMRLPADPAVPIVCVCGGTGIASFLGFLQDRAAQKQAGMVVGEVALYFGCRSDYDFLHEGQLREWEADGICRLSVSYSRKSGVEKEYVYKAVQRDADKLRALLGEQSRGCFYICGSASTLAKDTTRVMHNVLGHGDSARGREVFNVLQECGRIILDVWG